MTVKGGGRLSASAGLVGAAAVAYVRLVRPRLISWGATEEEITGPFPGADLLPGGERSGAMAVTIDARPEQVWPWLLQLGWDRAGWYSWDHLDNAGRPSAHEIHPEWQDLAGYIEGLWGFLLNELPEGRTRLVVSGYQAMRPRWLEPVVFSWLFPPVVWVMQARMLAVFERNAERAARPVASSGRP